MQEKRGRRKKIGEKRRKERGRKKRERKGIRV